MTPFGDRWCTRVSACHGLDSKGPVGNNRGRGAHYRAPRTKADDPFSSEAGTVRMS
jgi:hypothetical protein